ncbi:MAG: hypothetical protein H0V55_04695 [Thermoleophilaceae bacterium]|jgi:hypothetical protein|nr:hypothetical protein [Thermoleophilaceae bacterium]
MTGERGQASVEYTALLAVVAVLFAAVLLSDLPPPEAPSWLAAAMCAAWKGDRCAPSTELTRPPVALGARPASVAVNLSALPGAGPAAARVLDRLPPAEGLRLAERHPEIVGPLDGAPPPMRYAANRVLMERAVADLDAEVARIDREIARHRAAIAAGADLLARIRSGERNRELLASRSRRFSRWVADPRRNFLLFDPRGDGRVAEVVGDLDGAPHVAVMVPGTGSDIDNFDDHLAPRAHELRAAARRHAGADVAVVAWLGYDPPDTIPGAALGGRARNGGQALSRFVESVEVRGDPHTTVVGHSYGSVTTGNAAAGWRMPADDVVFTGSPGTGGRRRDVSALGGGSRFWAGEAPYDLVAPAPVHGEAPGDPGFGARLFDASGEERPPNQVVHNHQSYYRRGSASMRNLANIAGAWPDDVTPPPPRRPLLPRSRGFW